MLFRYCVPDNKTTALTKRINNRTAACSVFYCLIYGGRKTRVVETIIRTHIRRVTILFCVYTGGAGGGRAARLRFRLKRFDPPVAGPFCFNVSLRQTTQPRGRRGTDDHATGRRRGVSAGRLSPPRCRARGFIRRA